MSSPTFRPLYAFKVSQETKSEDPAIAHINTTTFFSFKELSRAEREDADEVRAAAWGRYIEKGLMPEAILIKHYTNAGGTYDEADHKRKNELDAALLAAYYDLNAAQINEKENADKIKELQLHIVTLRNQLMELNARHNVFFENTAEAKAKAKLIEYLVLHFSYWRKDEAKDWEPFFAGDTTEAKLASFDRMVEANDPLWAKARPTLEFLGTMRATTSEVFTKEQINDFLGES